MPPIPFDIHPDDRLLLKLPISDAVPAWSLKEIIGRIDDLYFGYLWLDRAAEHQGEAPLPDAYIPAEEETLYIHKLEIGTPNYVELIGLASALLPVASFLLAKLGIVESIGKIARIPLEYESLKLEVEKKKLELEQLKRAAAGAETFRVKGHPAYLQEYSEELLQGNRISPAAAEHKFHLQVSIDQDAGYIFQTYSGQPEITLIRGEK